MLSFSLINEGFVYGKYVADVDPLTGQEIYIPKSIQDAPYVSQNSPIEFLRQIKNGVFHPFKSAAKLKEDENSTPGQQFDFDDVEPMY